MPGLCRETLGLPADKALGLSHLDGRLLLISIGQASELLVSEHRLPGLKRVLLIVFVVQVK